MSTRFEMAEAVVKWARKRYGEMDPYTYQSLQLRLVTTNLRIAVKEVLDHLRSALDYSAREICERCSRPPAASDTKVYFPIARKGARQEDFPSLVGKLLPGILGVRDDLVAVLASFQGFSSPERNAWLPDFATLCNENKHEQLSLQRSIEFPVEISHHQGTPVYALHRKDKAYMGKGALMGVTRDHAAPGKSTGLYFRFDAIDHEVVSFLNQALDGVENIVKELKDTV